MDFIKFASDRFSVRKYNDKHLEKEVIDKILLGGHIAPTGCNNQPQRILVLNTDESMEKLRKCTQCHFDAPTAMVICYNKNESWVRKYDGAMSAPVDATIVATHMMLTAHSLGVGSCMVMSFNPESLRGEFKIPHEFEATMILTLGYPHEDAKPLDIHSKFRPQSETVDFEEF
ncbi:MAG: nitroreductase family protein [Eubacteriales bacterium]|nr:nitroreductase family protein [Eubacteriales bacterium]